MNSSSFVWDYSDGTTLSTKDAIVKHTYTRAGSYVPKMILTDATGCSVPIAGKDTIKVVEVVAKFGVDNRLFCDSGSVKFRDSSVSNEAIKSWQWSFGNGKSSSEQHPENKYTTAGSFLATLIATTQTGCKDTAIIEKKVEVYQGPAVTIAGNLESCVPAKLGFRGDVIRGNVAFLKWNWNFGNGQTSVIQNPSEQTYNKDGAYQLSAIVTDEHGCKANVVKTVNIHPLPAVDAGNDVLLCRDDSVQLQARGADKYNWKTANSLSCIGCDKPFVAPKETTVYHVTGFSRFGCSSTDSVKVRVRQKFSVTVSANDSLCAGNSTTISATGADQYSWSPTTGLDHANIANPKARPLTSTLYTLVAKDNDNCFTQTASVFIKVNPIPTIDAGEDLSLPAGGSVQLKTTSSTDVNSWQWSPAYNLSCTNCSTPKAAPKRTTKYAVTVKNSGGCTNTDHVTVLVVCNNGNLFIPNTFSPNNDGNNDRFYPRGRGIAMIRSLRVFNRWGEVVFERVNFNANDAAAGWDGTHKGQQLSTDVFIYSCEVVCENNEVLPFTGDISLIR
jgi:gliding motility-associated-like protein